MEYALMRYANNRTEDYVLIVLLINDNDTGMTPIIKNADQAQ